MKKYIFRKLFVLQKFSWRMEHFFLILRNVFYRQSALVESSVNDLIGMLKGPLTQEELSHMLSEDNSEPDAYTTLLTYYTQRNTDALVKCKFTELLNMGFFHIETKLKNVSKLFRFSSKAFV
jgi:hypothetical protein